MCFFGGVVVAWGGQYVKGLRFTEPVGEPVSVALVQGNIPQDLKFDKEALAYIYQHYYEQVSYTRAQIVVLPETAFPQFFQK